MKKRHCDKCGCEVDEPATGVPQVFAWSGTDEDTRVKVTIETQPDKKDVCSTCIQKAVQKILGVHVTTSCPKNTGSLPF